MASATACTHTRPELADLPARTLLAIDGHGAPDGPAFAVAVEALYAALGQDAPLEGTLVVRRRPDRARARPAAGAALDAHRPERRRCPGAT